MSRVAIKTIILHYNILNVFYLPKIIYKAIFNSRTDSVYTWGRQLQEGRGGGIFQIKSAKLCVRVMSALYDHI